MPVAGFSGLRVLALESRHANEMAKLIASYSGQPTLAPAMREVCVESPEALEFAAGLLAGKFDMVIFLTAGLTEEEAYLRLRRESRQQRKSMKEIAEAIVGAELERGQKRRSG